MERRAVIAAAAAILISFLSVFVVQVYEGHRRALADAWDVITVITQVANDHAYRSFQSVKGTLEQARLQIAQGAPAAEASMTDTTLVREIAVLDAEGTVIRSSVPGSVGARPFAVADLQRARLHADLLTFGPIMPGRSFGSTPEEGQRSQRHLLPVLMPTSTGQFVAAAINPTYFADVYTPIAATNEFSVALATLQGTVVAVSAGSPLAVGVSLAGSPPFNGEVLNRQSGRVGEPAGSPDLAAFRVTPLFPFVTMVSVPRVAVLENWQWQTLLLASLLALVLIGLLAGTTTLVRQIGLRQRQQRKLEEAERSGKIAQLLSAIVDSPSSLTAVVTPDLGIVRANASFLASLDCPTGSLRPALQRPDVSGGERIVDFAERRTPEAENDFDLTISRGNGVFSILRFRMTRHAFPDIGDCLVLVGHDETHRRTTEMALAQSAKLITLGEMATGMAHELNQPLNVIKMAAQSARLDLEDGGGGAAAPVAYIEGQLRRIEDQVDRAASIIAHMRIFGRAPSGEPERIDACQVCRDAVGLVREQLRASGVDIAVVDPREALMVKVHRILIEQVIVNLAVNARDAIVGDGRTSGSVRVRPQRAENGGVTILVSDDGPGVPPALRKRLFEPFFTTKPVGKGIGLGLAISFGIVRDSGGTLSLAEENDTTTAGATFRIDLPAAA